MYGSLQGSKTGKGKNAEIVYVVPVTVPKYEEHRTIKIRLTNYSTPTLIGITADGPTDSPHRYPRTNHLCMWHPDAPDDERWTPDEDLLRLILYATVHLFREAYWRETHVWAGPEAPHGDLKEET